MLEFLKSGLKRAKRLSVDEYREKLRSRGLVGGSLVPDSVPLAPPLGYKKQPSMVEIVRDMVRSERLANEARAAGQETFEESEDFEVGDDPELLRSEWENEFDPPLPELLKAGDEAVKARSSVPASLPGTDPVPPTEGPGAAGPPSPLVGQPAKPAS